MFERYLLRLKRNKDRGIAYIAYILAAILSGCVAIMVANSFSYFETLYFELYDLHKIAVIVASPFLFWLGSYLVQRFSPYAGGSGIPQVIRAVEIKLEGGHEYTRLNTLGGAVIKIVSAIVGLMGGASIGREGPTAQISATLFQTVSHRLDRFSKYIHDHEFLIAGASAGIAAAFNAPLAGVVFAFEEIALSHFMGIKNFVLLAIIVGGITSQALGGNYVYFGAFNLQQETSSLSILHALFIGAVCGFFGTVFSQFIVRFRSYARKQSRNKRFFVYPLILGVLVTLIGFVTDGRTLGPGSHIAKEALKGAVEVSWYVSPLKMLATMFSFVSGMSGGIFAPSLSIGALFGVTCSTFLTTSSSGLLSLMGMSAFLAAVTHAPLTAFIIVMEMTDKHVVLIPLMISVFTSYLVSVSFGAEPIYHRLAKDIVI